MIVLVAAALAASPCPVDRTPSELTAALDGADAAWGASAADFAVAVSAVRAIVPCLGAPIDTPTAAHVHRVEGLAAFAARDKVAAAQAFAAARAADPAWALPAELAPEGGPLRAVWDQAPAAGAARPLPTPGGGELRVDGVPGHTRAEARPVLLQVVTKEGRARDSAWLAAGAAPTYPRARPVAAWIGTGACLLAGGALLGVATAANDDYQASSTVAQAEERRAVVNGLAGGAVGLGAVGLGLGVFALSGSF